MGLGGWAWDDARRIAFANDLDDDRTLRTVTGSANRSKGAADPSNWIPPHEPALCEYLGDWIAIKARWELSMDQSEHGRIRNLLTDECPDQQLASVARAARSVATGGDIPGRRGRGVHRHHRRARR